MMDYKKAYYSLIERLKEAKEDAGVCDERYCCVIDELIQEPEESERIRKAISQCVEDMRGQFEKLYSVHHKDAIAWLEKQGRKEQLYIRFGKIPTNEKSKIYQGEIEVGTENGVSVYPAFKTDEGDIVLGLNLPITKTTLHTQQHLLEYDDRPCYLVKGDYVGKDTDGQPLINNVSIIKKIDSYRVKEEKQGQKDPCKDCKHPMLNCYNFPCLKKQEYQGKTALEAIHEQKADNANKVEQKTFLQKCFNTEYERGKNDAVVWSEEDEQIALSIGQVMDCAALLNIVPEKIDKIRTWLQSLKQRATWKPTEEQLYWLRYAADSTSDTEKGNAVEAVLKELYEQLKKL